MLRAGFIMLISLGERFMTRISRRGLLKGAAAGTAALAGSRLLDLPYLMAQAAPTGDKAKLRTAVIGCGGRGTDAMVPPAAAENLVALVDPDAGRIANALKRAKKVADDSKRPFDETKIKTSSDTASSLMKWLRK